MDRDLGYNDSNTKEENLLRLEQYQALLSSACQTTPFPIQGNSGFDPLSIGMLFPFQPSSISFLQDQDNVHYWPSGGHLQSSSVQEGFFSSLQEMSASVNGVLHGKRLGDICIDHPKISKKPRFESRPSLSTFKVRKEKLGDRIAALQQLVAPFGKTDTASVLMEATGYIKFLQDQVETLSVPYMRPSNSKEFHTTDEVSSTCDQSNPKPDLRSRGLCLVPLSCTSYFTNDDNSLWPPHNFR